MFNLTRLPSKVVIVFLLLIITIGSISAEKKQENTLSEKFNYTELAGIVWSTVDGENVKSGFLGSSDAENNISINQDTKMQVGSVGKTVLATGVLRLVTLDKLRLDDRVSNLLPMLEIKNQWDSTSPITIKHLLEHTSGLDNIRMSQFLSEKVEPDTSLMKAFKSSNSDLLQVRSKPGAQYSYSNMGYMILAMVIEKITDTSYEEFMESQVLRPIGMLDSTFKFKSQKGEYEDPLLSWGHFEGLAKQAAIPMVLRPAGQFTTSSRDMAKFSQLYLNNGLLEGDEFIDADLVELASITETTNAAKAGLKIGHGLVFALRDRHGVVGACHPGTTFGFRANLCIFPDEKKAFFYAINTDSESFDYEVFNQHFINQLNLTNHNMKSVEADIKPTGIDKKTLGFYSLSPNNMQQFELLDFIFNSVLVSETPSGIKLKPMVGQSTELMYQQNGHFRQLDRTLTSHVFYENGGASYFSNGLLTYKKGAELKYAYMVFSIACGLFSLLLIFALNSYRLLKRNFNLKSGLVFINVVLFSLPIILFSLQPFTQTGDFTAASLSLAVVSGGLIITSAISLVFSIRSKSFFEGVNLLFILNMCLCLSAYSMLPFRIWI